MIWVILLGIIIWFYVILQKSGDDNELPVKKLQPVEKIKEYVYMNKGYVSFARKFEELHPLRQSDFIYDFDLNLNKAMEEIDVCLKEIKKIEAEIILYIKDSERVLKEIKQKYAFREIENSEMVKLVYEKSQYYIFYNCETGNISEVQNPLVNEIMKTFSTESGERYTHCYCGRTSLNNQKNNCCNFCGGLICEYCGGCFCKTIYPRIIPIKGCHEYRFEVRNNSFDKMIIKVGIPFRNTLIPVRLKEELCKGCIVYHVKFAYGTVLEINDAYIEVDFFRLRRNVRQVLLHSLYHIWLNPALKILDKKDYEGLMKDISANHVLNEEESIEPNNNLINSNDEFLKCADCIVEGVSIYHVSFGECKVLERKDDIINVLVVKSNDYKKLSLNTCLENQLLLEQIN